MPVIELIDKIDQQSRGRYYRSNGGVNGTDDDGRKDDLILSEEGGGGGDGINGADSPSDGYLGLEQELEYRLQRRRRGRLLAFSALAVSFALGIAVKSWREGNVGSAVGSTHHPSGGGGGAGGKPKPSGGGSGSGSGSGSGGKQPTKSKSTPSPTPSPIKSTPELVEEGELEIESSVSLWPTASPIPPFKICPPPLVADRKSDRKHHSAVFHIGDIDLVPESPKGKNGTRDDEDYWDDWEYTFSAMDISDDASIVAVGLEDFSGSTKFEVGCVRAFAWSCNDQKWLRLGQDLRGTNEMEQFGHRVSSSEDGTVMAVSAPQESYDGGNGFVDVYYLTDDQRWERLGGRVDNLDSSLSYDRMGHAMDLSDKGDTLAVLGVVDSNSYIVRVFTYDVSKSDWVMKGRGIPVKVNYDDSYEYAPQLSLSDDGDQISISDPEFGVVRYEYKFEKNRWDKLDSRTVTFDDEGAFWIDSLDVDDSGDIIAYTAWEPSATEESDVNTVKIMDFSNGTATVIYSNTFRDYAVSLQVAVSDNGRVAATVAAKIDVDDDAIWETEDYVGSLYVVSDMATDNNGWSVVGMGTAVEGMGVPGNFVTLSGDGRIVAVGSESVVALYGIALKGDEGSDSTGGKDTEDDTGAEAEGDDEGDSAGGNGTALGSIFDVCPPYPDADPGNHAGDLFGLPARTEDDEEHTISIASNADASIIAIGIDSYDGEDRGIARAYGWSCDENAYKPYGEDLYGAEEFDGFGQSVALSADGLTMAVGANQPPPGKSGYVEVYTLDKEGGTWNLVGHRLDNVADSVGDVGREVRLSEDGSIVAFSGSILADEDTYGYGFDQSWVRVMRNKGGEWKTRGDDIIASVEYDEYGDELHIDLSGDGDTLAVVGSYSAFTAKVYSYDKLNKNWTETVIPPITTRNNITEEELYLDDDELYWEDYDYEFTTYFTGRDVALSSDGTSLAVAGAVYDELYEETAMLRSMRFDAKTGNWTLMSDPVEYDDDYLLSSVGSSSDGMKLAVGINSHGDNADDEGVLYVVEAVVEPNGTTTEEQWMKGGTVDGRGKGDLLGSRVCISPDGTMAMATSRRGYVSFFKFG